MRRYRPITPTHAYSTTATVFSPSSFEIDLFAPLVSSARRRIIWLIVNLFNGFIAASVIGRFDATIERMVALAVLMPVVASMGGVAGTQTLTLFIRGLALEQVGRSNVPRLLLREIGVGLLNALALSLAVGIITGSGFTTGLSAGSLLWL